MTLKTHRKISVCFAFIGAMVIPLYEINYYIALIMLVTFSDFGGRFPDLDHTWDNVADKTIFKWIINKIILCTGGRHRSKHTHSLDICIYFNLALVTSIGYAFNNNYIGATDRDILMLMLLGFGIGWLSHLYADMLNYTGIYLSFLCKTKNLRFVPKRIFNIKFKTGEQWEDFVYMCHVYINALLGALAVSYPVLHGTLGLI